MNGAVRLAAAFTELEPILEMALDGIVASNQVHLATVLAEGSPNWQH